jgi:2-keto-4-pentenoate hydratase/2-oxohepta-3-ene-1,7-dioic acid hydratase in catechol pathway
MKLVRYGEPGRERPGLIDVSGAIRDLSALVQDLSGESLSPATLARIRAADPASLPLVPGKPRLGPCVGKPGNFIAIGLNYADHAAEAGMAVPAEPILFSKAPNCCVGATDDIVIPKASTKLDWELELAFVIGSRASYVSEDKALDHVAGYFICNDVSEREWQIERLGQWVKGKSAPTFGPIGPWLVTPDDIGDVQNLDMWLDVNGQRQQTGNTRTMVFGVRKLVSYVSQFLTLDPGDIITTGTPPGVAMGRKPPNYLKAGDVVSLGIQGLGEQRCNVVAYKG